MNEISVRFDYSLDGRFFAGVFVGGTCVFVSGGAASDSGEVMTRAAAFASAFALDVADGIAPYDIQPDEGLERLWYEVSGG